jgi:regulator of protease activity HflC (stomatin/prohibitin superfamily)
MVSKTLGSVVLALSTVACSGVSPDAGHEAVLLKKPCCFGAGGFEIKPIAAGRTTYVALTTDSIDVNILPRQQEVTFDDLFTADGVPLDFHSAVQYQIIDSVVLVRDFGADDGPNGMGFFVRVLEQKYRQIVRDAVKKHGLNEMAIMVTAAQEVDEEVTARFAKVIADLKVPIRLISVTLGRANPPDAIKHQRIATAEQEQRQKTEQQAKLAEDQRKMHEESRASADRAYNEKMGISPEQYLQLEQIKMLRDVCRNGACTFLMGSDVSPIVNIKQK